MKQTVRYQMLKSIYKQIDEMNEGIDHSTADSQFILHGLTVSQLKQVRDFVSSFPDAHKLPGDYPENEGEEE